MPNVITAHCSCGEAISIEIDAKLSARTDRKRPFYPDEHTEPLVANGFVYDQSGVTTFRCRGCGGFVSDTVPEAAFEGGNHA